MRIGVKGVLCLTSLLIENGELYRGLGDDRALTLYRKLPKGKKLRTKLIFKIAGESQEAIDVASTVRDDTLSESAT